MASSWALICSIAFVSVLLSSSWSDDHGFEQREVIPDFDKIKQEKETPMLQSEIDWTVLLKELVMSTPEVPLTNKGGSRPKVLTPRGRQPGFGPRFFGGAPVAYPVQFPLGRPTADNLQAICLHGDHRPRYPDSYFPASGFSSQFRKGRAVNNAEFWFSTCCEGNQTWERDVTVCCATQAWERSIKAYCKEEFSIKTAHYHCCKLQNRNRLNCFHNNAPNPNYEPTEEIPVAPLPSTNKLNFDPNTCQRTPYITSQKIDINFPPGRPTADTIESLCLHQHLRPLYNVTCLPGLGYKLLSRQAKTINRMEKGFKRCCKKQDVLSCADQNWREELNRFCLDENGGRVDFQCCSSDEANDRYSCFQHISPEPQYNMTTATEELSLIKICETHNIIERKFAVGFPIKSLVDQCCPLPEQDKTICFSQKLKKMSGTLCTSSKTSPSIVRRCCQRTQETGQCVSKILTDAITKASSFLPQKKKKKCPIS